MGHLQRLFTRTNPVTVAIGGLWLWSAAGQLGDRPCQMWHPTHNCGTAMGLEPVSNLVYPPVNKDGALENLAFVDSCSIWWIFLPCSCKLRATIRKPRSPSDQSLLFLYPRNSCMSVSFQREEPPSCSQALNKSHGCPFPCKEGMTIIFSSSNHDWSTCLAKSCSKITTAEKWYESFSQLEPHKITRDLSPHLPDPRAAE